MNIPVKNPVAKLLKQKGYNEPCKYFYDGDSNKTVECLPHTSINELNGDIDIPTIDEVRWWLYKNHGIWIQVTVNDMWVGNKKSYTAKFNSEVVSQNRNFKVRSLICTKIRIEPYDCPIEAYEAAIEYILNNLI